MARAIPRKNVVKHQPTVKRTTFTTVVKTMAGKRHLHGCITSGCSRTYEDVCQTPEVNGTCRPCTGRERPVWDESRDARPCCTDSTVLITSPDLILTFLLAGPGPWFKCVNCARCFPSPITTLKENR